MADELPKTTDDLLARIESEWNALQRVVERLTPQQMATPDAGGWSPKDNLAHLATWMKYMKDAALNKMPPHEALGMTAAEHAGLDEDAENAIIFERNRARPAAEVLSELRSTYSDVLHTLRRTPFADLMKPFRPGGTDNRLVIHSVIGNTYEHFREHRQTIEKAL